MGRYQFFSGGCKLGRRIVDTLRSIGVRQASRELTYRSIEVFTRFIL
jgi:hypothetical protein